MCLGETQERCGTARSTVLLLHRSVFEEVLQEFPMERRSLQRSSALDASDRSAGVQLLRGCFRSSAAKMPFLSHKSKSFGFYVCFCLKGRRRTFGWPPQATCQHLVLCFSVVAKKGTYLVWGSPCTPWQSGSEQPHFVTVNAGPWTRVGFGLWVDDGECVSLRSLPRPDSQLGTRISMLKKSGFL